MVSAGGLNQAEARWVELLEFDHEQIMTLWRFAGGAYLWKAYRDGLLHLSSLPEKFNDLILRQTQRRWTIHITGQMSKWHFLKICRTLCSPATHLSASHPPCDGTRSCLPRKQVPRAPAQK
jgi:hypothetical protein